MDGGSNSTTLMFVSPTREYADRIFRWWQSPIWICHIKSPGGPCRL